jgi:sporulation protein YlmC with PRC-barrel domain
MKGLRWIGLGAIVVFLAVPLTAMQYEAGHSEQQATQIHLQQGSQLLGMAVQNPQGEKLGEIQDIVLNPQQTDIDYAAVAYGGFAGIGEKLLAVPWEAFELKSTGAPGPRKAGPKCLVLNVTQDRLKRAEGFKSENWPEQASQQWRDLVRQRRQKMREHMTAQMREHMQMQEPFEQQQTQPQASRQQMIQCRRLSHIIGMDVRLSEQRQIGRLGDVHMDAAEGQPVYGLIALQDQNKHAAVPWSSIDIQPGRQYAWLDASESTIMSYAFTPGQEPNLSDPDYARELFLAYDQGPYWEVLGFVSPAEEGRMQFGPQQPFGQLRSLYQSQPQQAYDPEGERSFLGTIQARSQLTTQQGRQHCVFHVLTQEGQGVFADVGPGRILQQQGIQFSRNDQIRFTGSHIKVGGEDVVLVRTIQKLPQQATIRNPKGDLRMQSWQQRQQQQQGY